MKKATSKQKNSLASMYRPDQYNYSVLWSEEDEAFVSRVTEFPSLAAHGKTQEKAIEELRQVVSIVIEDLISNRETVPLPIGKRKFSGKLNVRMSSELHRRLAVESEQQGVSLNALINLKLAA